MKVRRCTIALVIVGLLALGAVPALAAERVALVVGNAHYTRAQRLANPLNDAADVGAAFTRLRFAVNRVDNADKARLEQGLHKLMQAATGSEIALVFYAGHGIDVDKRNFLVPVGTRLASEQEVGFETVSQRLTAEQLAAQRLAAERKLLFWESVKDSTNPADILAYLECYTNGVYAMLARNRLEALRSSEAQERARRKAEERARREAAEAERRRRELEPGRRFRDCPECPQMVVVPSRSFRMGSPPGETGRFDDEAPVHRVTIAKPFAVGVHEVTRGEFGRFVRETNRSMGNSCWGWDSSEEKWAERSGRHWRNPGFAQTDGHPVVCVSWDDAQAYVRWLSAKTRQGYRLLSESEWEYVARAGTLTARYWGESESGQCGYANGADASKDFIWRVGCNDGHARTSPVGHYTENGFGLYDVLGNVWEWTQDCWNDSYAGAPRNGGAWQTGNCSQRVVRGGSWIDRPRGLRSAIRLWDSTGSRVDDLGFRIARTLTP